MTDQTTAPQRAKKTGAIKSRLASWGPGSAPQTWQTQYYLTPEMFGAVGNGVTDDSGALNAMVAAALTAGVGIRLAPKVYAIANPWVVTVDTGGTSQTPLPFIIGSGYGDGNGIGTTIKAITGMSGKTMFKYQNVTNTYVFGICFECNSIAATGIDSSWNVGSGPSLNNGWEYIQIRNWQTSGWIALNNNDVTFRRILMDNPSNVGLPAISIQAAGGNCVFDQMVIDHGHIDINCQDAQFLECNTQGFLVNAASTTSHIAVTGGYHYADSTTDIVVNVAGVATNFTFDGGPHIEMATTSGLIFGGSGTLQPGATILGAYMICTAGSAGGAVVGSSLGANVSNGVLGRITVIGGAFYNGISFASTSSYNVGICSLWNQITGALSVDTLFQKASLQGQPGNPTAPNSTSAYKMQGLGQTIKPICYGNLMIVISGTITSTATTVDLGIAYQISYGTGGAPSSNAALTGTQVGTAQTATLAAAASAAADVNIPFNIQAVVTGLTLGTTYWIDLAAKAITAASDVALTSVSVSAMEF